MKIIQNNYLDQSHKNIGQTVVESVQKSEKLDFMVAYIKDSGLNVLSKYISNKNIRIICSLDMGTTDLSALQRLIKEYNAQIKICKLLKGTFHSKMWIFDNKTCLIGSANMTLSAFTSNVETGVFFDNAENVKSANQIFEYFWQLEKNTISSSEIVNLISNRNKLQDIKVKTETITNTELSQIELDSDRINNILDFVKSWAEMDVGTKKSSEIAKAWRGWYIIPDQGYIDQNIMTRLQKICNHIYNKGKQIDISKNSSDVMELEDLLNKIKELKRIIHKTPMRDLFIRQEKNYMEKFEFIHMPDRKTICLTDQGIEIANTDDMQKIRFIYTNAIRNKEHYGLNMYDFTKECLLRCDKYLNYEEFNWFVCHAMEKNDISVIVDLIKGYRKLNNHQKEDLEQEINKLLKENKEHTNKGVVMNYNKNVRHTMSALGWTNDIYFNRNDHTLSIRE